MSTRLHLQPSLTPCVLSLTVLVSVCLVPVSALSTPLALAVCVSRPHPGQPPPSHSLPLCPGEAAELGRVLTANAVACSRPGSCYCDWNCLCHKNILTHHESEEGVFSSFRLTSTKSTESSHTAAPSARSKAGAL